MKNRLWEIDALRGVAIINMIIFHGSWDLTFLGIADMPVLTSTGQFYARSIACTFLFLLGISLTLSHHHAQRKLDPSAIRRKFLQRGGMIFVWGMLITIATYFFIGPNGFVVFGILHLLGFSVILGYLFLTVNRWITLAVAFIFLAVGAYINPIFSDSPWLLWLGIKQYGRSMVDYYPVLPWSGVALLGVFVGHTVYSQATRQFSLPDWSAVPAIAGLRFLGRHSLLIYLLHQPILLGGLMALQLLGLF